MVRGRHINSGNGEGEMVDHLGYVQVILAGEGQGSGLQRGEKVERGRMVGIRGPVWEVFVGGVKWGVGVDWKVLRDGS